LLLRTDNVVEHEPSGSSGSAMEADALIATSGEQTSLFIAPPLIVEEDKLGKIFEALHHGLELADAEYDATTPSSETSTSATKPTS
jgi:hypothetical protein